MSWITAETQRTQRKDFNFRSVLRDLCISAVNLIKKPAGPLFDELLKAIRAFSADHKFDDDVCLVGMEFTGKPL